MSELIKKRVRESIGSYAKVFLENGFKYEGQLTNSDEKHLEVKEKRGFKIIKLEDISDLEIKLSERENGQNNSHNHS